MILRILEEGQFELDDGSVEELNALDDRLLTAMESNDEKAFEETLAQLLEQVRAGGSRVPDDFLGASDLVLPAAGSSIEEVRAFLGDEGLIPG